MSEETTPSKWQRFRATLREPYRVVVMNNDTFEERASTRLTLLNIWIIMSTIVVLTGLLVFLLLAYTPLNRYIPGYANGATSGEIMELRDEIAALEQEMAGYERYTQRIQAIIREEADTSYLAVDDTDTELDVEEPEPVERVPEDEQLRNELALSELRDNESGEGPSVDTSVPLERMFFYTPVSGEISSGFLAVEGHYGVDILAPKNKEIKSVMDGVVIQSDWTLETGNTVGVQHDNNVITFYKHNSVNLKNVGDRVRAGEAIAIIGNTGTLSDGPHLHFELWSQGKPIDPALYVSFN